MANPGTFCPVGHSKATSHLPTRQDPMDSPTTDITQLLSGMLDGVLSESEANVLLREMAKDPSLGMQLESLRVARQSLRIGRSSRLLRPDFAESVTFAAKKRATEMEENAPAWLVSSAPPITLAPGLTNSAPWRRWLFAGGLSLAATVLFLVSSFPKKERQGFVAIPEVNVSEDERTALSGSEVEVEAPKLEILRPLETKPIELLAQSENQLKAQPSDTPRIVSESVAASTPSNETIATPKPKRSTTVPTFTMIVDFSIAPQALDAQVLEKILEKYSIVYTDELVLNDAQLKMLEESNFVGNIENTLKVIEPLSIDASRIPKVAVKQNAEEKMGVLFLRSSAKNLGMAMTEIFQSVDQFPDCALEISTDNSAQQLVAQLSFIQVAETTAGVAKRLSFAGAQGSTPFASAEKRGKPMSPDKRAKFKAPNPSILTADQANMSNALFLLRPAKK